MRTLVTIEHLRERKQDAFKRYMDDVITKSDYLREYSEIQSQANYLRMLGYQNKDTIEDVCKLIEQHSDELNRLLPLYNNFRLRGDIVNLSDEQKRSRFETEFGITALRRKISLLQSLIINH